MSKAATLLYWPEFQLDCSDFESWLGWNGYKAQGTSSCQVSATRTPRQGETKDSLDSSWIGMSLRKATRKNILWVESWEGKGKRDRRRYSICMQGGGGERPFKMSWLQRKVSSTNSYLFTYPHQRFLSLGAEGWQSLGKGREEDSWTWPRVGRE